MPCPSALLGSASGPLEFRPVRRGQFFSRDDAAVIYINGTEVWRDMNITSGVITATTAARVALGGADETNWLTLDLSIGIRSLLRSLLVSG